MGETKYEVKDLGTEDGTKLLYFDCDDIEYATSEEIIAGTLPEDQREDYHAHISRHEGRCDPALADTFCRTGQGESRR